MNATQWLYRKIRDNMRQREKIADNGYKSRRLSHWDYVQAYRELHRLLDQAWITKQ